MHERTVSEHCKERTAGPGSTTLVHVCCQPTSASSTARTRLQRSHSPTLVLRKNLQVVDAAGRRLQCNARHAARTCICRNYGSCSLFHSRKKCMQKVESALGVTVWSAPGASPLARTPLPTPAQAAAPATAPLPVPSDVESVANNATSNAAPLTESAGDTGSSNLGPILGGVIGGLLALAALMLLAALLVLRARSRRQARTQSPSEAPQGIGRWHGGVTHAPAPAATHLQDAQQSRHVMGKQAASPSAGATHMRAEHGSSMMPRNNTLSSCPEQRSLAATSTADTLRAVGSMPSSGSRVSPSTLPSAMSLTQRRITPAANGGPSISGVFQRDRGAVQHAWRARGTRPAGHGAGEHGEGGAGAAVCGAVSAQGRMGAGRSSARGLCTRRCGRFFPIRNQVRLRVKLHILATRPASSHAWGCFDLRQGCSQVHMPCICSLHVDMLLRL